MGQDWEVTNLYFQDNRMHLEVYVDTAALPNFIEQVVVAGVADFEVKDDRGSSGGMKVTLAFGY